MNCKTERILSEIGLSELQQDIVIALIKNEISTSYLQAESDKLEYCIKCLKDNNFADASNFLLIEKAPF